MGQTSHHCDNIPDTNNLRAGRLMFGSKFQSILWLHFGPLWSVVRTNIMVLIMVGFNANFHKLESPE